MANLPIAYAYAVDLFYIYFIGVYDSISIGEGNSTIMICVVESRELTPF